MNIERSGQKVLFLDEENEDGLNESEYSSFTIEEVRHVGDFFSWNELDSFDFSQESYSEDNENPFLGTRRGRNRWP